MVIHKIDKLFEHCGVFFFPKKKKCECFLVICNKMPKGKSVN